MLKDAESIRIIIYLMRQEPNAQIIRKIQSGPRKMVLKHTKECLDHFLILTRVSKPNRLDMSNCFIIIFINIFAHTELVDWLYCEYRISV